MFAKYIIICHSCEFKQDKCNGFCPCTIDNIDIIQHAKTGDCPKNRFVGITVENKPFPTVRQIATFAQALAIGKKVSLDIIKERTEMCRKCEFARQTESGDMWCGQCGCSFSSDDRKIQNLAAYEENLPVWGCKYPDRTKGGWKILEKDEKEKATQNESPNLTPTRG